jgi:hypothetical protein
LPKRRSLALTLQCLQDHGIQEGEHDLVVPDEGVARSSSLRGALHNIIGGTLVLAHSQIHREKTLHRIAHIATEGEGLEKDFW